LLAAAQRVWLWLSYPVVRMNDTGAYRRAAEAISNGWTYYDGTRVPGYPAFLAWAGPDERAYLAQLALGLITTLLFYFIGWRLTGRHAFGALAALTHSLNAGQFFFEATLMTETLTTFWLALAAAAVTWLSAPPSYGAPPAHGALSWAAAALAGLAVGLSLLTRPLFVAWPFWIGFFLWAALRKFAPARRWGLALTALLPGALLLAGWLNFIHSRFGFWNLSTNVGYHMIQHTGNFFEYVPDEYAGLRDTYLRYRDTRIAKYGSQVNTIWEAIPELQQVTTLGFTNLSLLIQKISVQLIREHPDLYLKNVVEGWFWFWKAPVFWRPGNFAYPGWAAPLQGVILIERGLMLAANALFIGGSALLVVWRKLRQKLAAPPPVWYIIGGVWHTSVLQTLLDHGDNVRFLVPLQSLVILVVLWAGWKLLEGKKHETTLAHPL
jgi:hypothetical protein